MGNKSSSSELRDCELRGAARDNNLDAVTKILDSNPGIKLEKSIISITLGYAYEPYNHDPYQVVEKLLLCGADPNYSRTQYDGVSCNDLLYDKPLYQAIRHDDSKMVALLLKHKANVNLKPLNGSIPLGHACLLGNEEIVIDLLKHKANLNLDDWRYNCIDIATKFSSLRIVSLLLRHVGKDDRSLI